MDNEQATLTQLAWLAGIIDGEGTISINPQAKNGYTRYFARFYITNTDPVMINECVKIVKGTCGFGMNVYTEHFDNPKHRTKLRAELTDTFKISKVLAELHPYLVNKQGLCELVMRFCLAKIAYGLGKNKNGQPLSERNRIRDDRTAIEKIYYESFQANRYTNFVRKSSEAIRYEPCVEKMILSYIAQG